MIGAFSLQGIQRCPQSQLWNRGKLVRRPSHPVFGTEVSLYTGSPSVWNRGKLVRRPSHPVFVAWHVPRKPVSLLLIATTDHGATELALLVMFFRLPHCYTEEHSSTHTNVDPTSRYARYKSVPFRKQTACPLENKLV